MTDAMIDVIGGVLDGFLASQLATFDASLQADGVDDDDRAALLAWAAAEYLIWRFDILEQLRASLQDDDRRH